MKRLTILSLLFIIFYACEQEPVDIKIPQQTLVLKQVNQTPMDSEVECPGRSSFFDDKGKIYLVDYTCGGVNNIHYTYEYTQSGMIYRIGGNRDFIYDENDTLIRQRAWNHLGLSYTDFTYYGNIVHAQGHVNYLDEPSPYFTQYEFEDESYKKLLSVTRYDTSNYDEIISRQTIQYEGNNPVEILIEKKYPEDIELAPKRRYNFTYDDKVNPYKIGLPENAYLATNFVLTYYTGYEIAFTADNNIVEVITTDYTFDTINVFTYNYLYYEEYPIEALFSVNEEPRRIDTYEYYQ